MSERKPKPGDKVRVTIDYTVDPSGHYVGKSIADEDYVTVEVLEPADDPSRDLNGAVRKSPWDGRVVVCARHIDPVGGERRCWIDLLPKPHKPWLLVDPDVVGWEVVGSVPGTPAAEQVLPPLVDAGPGHRPAVARVFSLDGPEPPEDVKVLVDSAPDPEESSFAYLIRTGDGWCWSPSPELIAPDFGPPGKWAERAGGACGTKLQEVLS